jgi:predicted nucleic acid-binding Zn ribbon protein
MITDPLSSETCSDLHSEQKRRSLSTKMEGESQDFGEIRSVGISERAREKEFILYVLYIFILVYLTDLTDLTC